MNIFIVFTRNTVCLKKGNRVQCQHENYEKERREKFRPNPYLKDTLYTLFNFREKLHVGDKQDLTVEAVLNHAH